jgi:hypothetical protein
MAVDRWCLQCALANRSNLAVGKDVEGDSACREHGGVSTESLETHVSYGTPSNYRDRNFGVHAN